VPSKKASTALPLHPHLANRWSPRGFDRDHALSDDELQALLEAVRWTPSCSNRQPWRLIIGGRGDATFQRIVDNLKPNNQTWAEYDTGQAIATMTTEASELGLQVHQMAGFEVAGIRATFAIPVTITPVTVVAVGSFDPDADLPEVLAERERAPGERLSIEDLLRTDQNQ